MPKLALIDNDVFFKISCFNCTAEFGDVVGADHLPRRLKLAEFVIRKKIAKSGRIIDKSGAQLRLDTLLTWADGLEPTDDELKLAAEIESIAQGQNLPFDSGESQLLAMHILRDANKLYTGDKRAIGALKPLCEKLTCLDKVAGKVNCFEQVLLALVGILGSTVLCERVCKEAGVDIAISICCGCASGSASEASVLEGLGSYIKHLREVSENLLAP